MNLPTIHGFPPKKVFSTKAFKWRLKTYPITNPFHNKKWAPGNRETLGSKGKTSAESPRRTSDHKVWRKTLEIGSQGGEGIFHGLVRFGLIFPSKKKRPPHSRSGLFSTDF